MNAAQRDHPAGHQREELRAARPPTSTPSASTTTRNKTAGPPGDRGDLRRARARRAHLNVKPKPKRRGLYVRHAPRLEEGGRRTRTRGQRSSCSRARDRVTPMAIRSTSRPARAVASRRTRTTPRSPRQAREVARRGPQEDRRAQHQRPRHLPPPRRRRQAPVPQDRLQAAQGRRARRRSPTIEYDPNRTAYIALLHYADGESATSSPRRLQRRRRVSSGPDAEIKTGNCLPLREHPDRHRPCTTSS